jgi:hypothetical protein
MGLVSEVIWESLRQRHVACRHVVLGEKKGRRCQGGQIPSPVPWQIKGGKSWPHLLMQMATLSHSDLPVSPMQIFIFSGSTPYVDRQSCEWTIPEPHLPKRGQFSSQVLLWPRPYANENPGPMFLLEFVCLFSVLGLELRAYALTHSTRSFL